jgi:hypothetical protein
MEVEKLEQLVQHFKDMEVLLLILLSTHLTILFLLQVLMMRLSESGKFPLKMENLKAKMKVLLF